jgi:hypothetical protein
MLCPCKHLDHSVETYGQSCELKTIDTLSVPVKYWARREVPYEGAPKNVQFCGQGRGRINSIFDCYEAPGPMRCHEPAEAAK